MSTAHEPPATTERRTLDKPAKEPHMSFGRWASQLGWRHLIGIVAVAFAVFPLLYLLSASLNPGSGVLGGNRLFAKIDFSDYQTMLDPAKGNFTRWFANTLIIAIVSSIGTVFLGALAAYAFSRMRFAGRRPGLLSLILIQMFPQLLAFVAIFLLMIGIGDVFPFLGLGSKAGLIMVYLGGALGVNTYLMYGFFNTVPQSLDEAARVDGAGHARIFFTIILRLVAPILAVVALLSFIGSFSDFLLASMLLQKPEDQTLAVGLQSMVGGNDRNEFWSRFAAGAVMSTIPIVVLFYSLQKYIVGGLTAGAVK